MLPPMVPVAPVTKAVLPVRSNIASSSNAQAGLELGDVVWRANRGSIDARGDALDQAGEHLAGTDLIERRHAGLRHEKNRLAPTHRAGDLLDKASHDVGRLADRPRQNVCDQRYGR